MKELKDNFSFQSANYAAYRPVYPDVLYQYLFNRVGAFDATWDCGTGNGQVAIKLAEKFKIVYATDISQNQLDNAVKKDNIQYSNQRAEQTLLLSDSVDLVTVAQAIHWFDFDLFYKEVRRWQSQEPIFLFPPTTC
jgi:ubiquinone/menaquinone biosynthesis C-methylase UbiE